MEELGRGRRPTPTVDVVVSLPLWAVFAVSFGSPSLAFVGVLVSQWIGRRTARELEIRSRREETMRTLRWAAELAIDAAPSRARLGSSQLTTLGRSTLLDSEQSLFVKAALDALVEPVDDEIGPDPVSPSHSQAREPAVAWTDEVAREDVDDG